MKIFIVIGLTGLYEDRHTWVVKSFKSKVRAEKYAKKAQQRAAEIVSLAIIYNPHNDLLDINHWDRVMEEEKNEFDERFCCDSLAMATNYFVSSPIELDEETDNVISP